jgi:hypothetical protein
LFVADFNEDGKPDILSGDGTLALGKPMEPLLRWRPASGTAVADFNGDGKADVLEQTTGTLVALLGKRDGTFQSPVTLVLASSLSCGGSSNPPPIHFSHGTPSGTYTETVTATSSGVSHTISLKVIVQ